MNGIKIMNNTINSLLLEAELKDVFDSIEVGDVFSVDLKDGRMFTYTVMENKGGDIKLRDRKPNDAGLYTIFIISKDSMNDTVMTTWKYDSNQSDGKGEEMKFNIKRIRTGKNTGAIETIDLEDPILADKYNKFNQEILKGEVGDTIGITTVEETNGEELLNNIFFKIHEIKQTHYLLSLVDVDGDSETLNNYYINFNDKNFYINTNNLIKILNNNTLNLQLAFKGRNNETKKININPIVDVSINKNDDSFDDENDENQTMSKKALQDILDKDPTYQKMINQQPGILDVLRGASAKGVYQLAKKLKQNKVNNSFLTRGKYVKFKWDSPKIYKDENNVLSRNGSYEGKVEREGVIKLGNRNSGFFNLTLLDEIEPSVYKVKVVYTNPRRNSNREPDGIIRITDNDSR
jgi:hypothetical protein